MSFRGKTTSLPSQESRCNEKINKYLRFNAAELCLRLDMYAILDGSTLQCYFFSPLNILLGQLLSQSDMVMLHTMGMKPAQHMTGKQELDRASPMGLSRLRTRVRS